MHARLDGSVRQPGLVSARGDAQHWSTRKHIHDGINKRDGTH